MWEGKMDTHRKREQKYTSKMRLEAVNKERRGQVMAGRGTYGMATNGEVPT